MSDMRVDLILRTNEEHMVRMAQIAHGKKREEWECQCGVGFIGPGAIKNGRRHTAEAVLDALDAAALVA